MVVKSIKRQASNDNVSVSIFQSVNNDTVYSSVWFMFCLGVYYHEPEITPSGAQGVFRFNASGTKVDSFPAEVEVRAVIEGQLLAKLSHARKLGYEINPSSRVLATGGASANNRILQVSRHIVQYGHVIHTVKPPIRYPLRDTI